MENKNEGKWVLVTGGTRGIGRVITLTLLEQGYDVVFTGTSGQSVTALVQEVRQLGGKSALSPVHPRLHGFVLDYVRLQSGGHAQWVESLCDRLPTSLYGIVHNAALLTTETLVETKGRADLQLYEVNIGGPAQLTAALLRTSARGSLRRIVNITSQLAHVGRAGYWAYSATKAALESQTRVWAEELPGTTVNSVCPCWVDTGITDEDLKRLAVELGKDPDFFREELESRLYHGRLVTPEEVANVVAFLLSDDASGVSGASIPVGGPFE